MEQPQPGTQEEMPDDGGQQGDNGQGGGQTQDMPDVGNAPSEGDNTPTV